MGYDNTNAQRLCFDIETAPLPEAGEYLVEAVDAPANYKDPLKIAAYIEEKNAEQLSRCSLDADLCRVVAISTWSEREGQPVAVVGGAMSEHDMLTWFWVQADRGHLVGFNCLAFDLPVLLRRSLYLGVQTPLLQIDRYRHPGVTDLMMTLSFNGVLKFRGLSFYAKRFGYEDIGTDGIDGSGIASAVAENRWNDVETHVLADVYKTAHIASKCGAFAPAPVGVY